MFFSLSALAFATSLGNYFALFMLQSERSDQASNVEFVIFDQKALHLTRVHCANFFQSALPQELLENVTPLNRRPFSRGLQRESLIRFSVKRCTRFFCY